MDLEFAKSLPVLFSQVREDPHLDLHVINSIASNELNILMIGSGGCTLAGLAYHSPHKIDVIDVNPAQIDLCKLKLFLAKESPKRRAQLLGHLPMEDRKNQLSSIFTHLNIPQDSLGDLEIVGTYGPDYVGRYEWLFRSFSNDFKKTKLGTQLIDASSLSEQQVLLSQDLTEIQNLFDAHFSLETLVELFGEEAVQNRSSSYSSHFYNRFIWSLRHQFVHQNPFFYQFAYLSYPKSAQSYFLSLPPHEPERISFYNRSMLDHLVSSKSDCYDYVHLSNILDWLDAVSIEHVLEETSRVLKPSGKLLIRQLNSTITIKNTQHLSFETMSENELIKNDLSFFYPKIYVGDKYG